jgi:hypothetical protein
MALQKNRINKLLKSKDSATFPFSKTDGNLASTENTVAFYSVISQLDITACNP